LRKVTVLNVEGNTLRKRHFSSLLVNTTTDVEGASRVQAVLTQAAVELCNYGDEDSKNVSQFEPSEARGGKSRGVRL